MAFSLLLGSGGGSRPSLLISLAAGVAVVDALAPLVPGHEIGIHWPNDVILDGRKLAGILIEILPSGKQVIGIGINTNNTAADAPAEVRDRVATLRDATERFHDPSDLLVSIFNRLKERLAELASDPEKIAVRTNELCLQRGELLEVVQGTSTIKGRGTGIAADGALIIELNGQSRKLYSGTVTSV